MTNLIIEIRYQIGKLRAYLVQTHRLNLQDVLNTLLLATIAVLLLILCLRVSNIHSDTITYYITNEGSTAETIEQIEPVKLGKALKEFIESDCKRYDVDSKLVHAIINSPMPIEDGLPRYGIMKIHPDLIAKYNANYSKDVGIVDSVYSNMESGVKRLAWALRNNSSLEGALMVYIYTKPQAQEMWSKGIKTTEWVENVKEELK